MSHLSTSRFAVLYKKLFGISPVDDLIEIRLARARILLMNATVSVSEVAAQTGFAGLCYFSRLFRRRVGCTPRDYARRDPLDPRRTRAAASRTIAPVETAPAAEARPRAAKRRSRSRRARSS